jgi:hypothetical protein
MNSYVTIDGHNLSLGELGDRLSQTCLALHGLTALMNRVMEENPGGPDDELSGRLALARLALGAMARQLENLLPE